MLVQEMRTRRKWIGHSHRIMSAVRFEAEEEQNYGSGGLELTARRCASVATGIAFYDR